MKGVFGGLLAVAFFTALIVWVLTVDDTKDGRPQRRQCLDYSGQLIVVRDQSQCLYPAGDQPWR